MFPERYTIPLDFTAAENGITGNGFGVASVFTISFLVDMLECANVSTREISNWEICGWDWQATR